MNIVIFGASSKIAEETAKYFAQGGDSLYLFARNIDRLIGIAADLRALGASEVAIDSMDAQLHDKQQEWIDKAVARFGSLDVAIIAYGTLGDQKRCERDPSRTIDEFNINATSVIALAARLANYFERRRAGTLVAIGSVSGDRGRGSNYAYGAAKASVAVFLQGLRNRLYRAGVSVITIKPGYISTPMTRHLRQGVLWTSAERAGKIIYAGIRAKKNVIYVPAWWRVIVLVIKLIPESLFKRLDL